MPTLSPQHGPGRLGDNAPGVPIGPYVIIRLMPLVGNDPHYQGKSEAGTIRALLESQITEVAE